jgi:serine/threonine protein kinase
MLKAINALKAKDQGINHIDNVQVLDRIGHGSFGEVYQGIWNETTRVALKRLHDKSEFEKFQKEASLLQYFNKNLSFVDFFKEAWFIPQ